MQLLAFENGFLEKGFAPSQLSWFLSEPSMDSSARVIAGENGEKEGEFFRFLLSNIQKGRSLGSQSTVI